MSQVYSTEPQTSANVIFETTYGPLSIHLWLKECPRTTMYFLQLCADGFYDNIVFHRIVPNFLIQTGDSKFRINQQEQDGGVVDVSSNNHNNNNNNTKNDDDDVSSKSKQPPPPKYREKHGAAEALDRRQFEVNSRIRFNHRGQVAMALGIDDDDTNNDGPRLQPQFFITLEDASHLDNKHVIFGGVTGPTIFNALRIGQIDVINNNDDDIRNFQPRIISEAPRILRTKIVQVEIPATLPALVPTVEPYLLPWRIDLNKTNNEGGVTAGNNGKSKRKKKARKGIKNVNLLSFGEEFNGEDDDDDENNLKIQSSHDLLGKDKKSLKIQPSSSRLNNQPGEKSHRQPSQEEEEEEEEDKDLSTEKKKESKKVQEEEEVQEPVTKDDVDTLVTYRKKKDTKDTPPNSIVPPQMEESNSGSAKKNNHSTSTTEKKPKKISLVEARRAKYLKKNSNKKGNKQQREEETMAKFKAFQQKITIGGANEKVEKRKINNNKDDDDEQHDVKGYHGQILDASDDSDWMNTKFKCKKHMDQDAKTGGDGRRADDYEVIDERSTATDRKHGKRKKYQY